mmetsp:Transcript_9775/g.15814  ORF Transcript_9775/g.15814 Transcript_9775/m.15814 type:complete len:82 (-) Transcript_9775:27-272(-)
MPLVRVKLLTLMTWKGFTTSSRWTTMQMFMLKTHQLLARLLKLMFLPSTVVWEHEKCPPCTQFCSMFVCDESSRRKAISQS